MKTVTLALAAAVLAATPAFPQVVVTDTNPALPVGVEGDRSIRVVRPAGQQPVLISGETVISATQPTDLNLTPLPGMEFSFTNQGGQIVIVAPANRTIQYFDN
ncbi:hypothetical protein [Jannaschia formosa]|uniref:hypothetical protein n=1 Tax=Jannaschia formosa TaxID=2259592 RepID=UPI000E1B74C8|nr:hypothetical protein [Jannaschia formosa]TFL18603.1 hypothetical protein DR046_08995 [Jannaschia formosa]